MVTTMENDDKNNNNNSNDNTNNLGMQGVSINDDGTNTMIPDPTTLRSSTISSSSNTTSTTTTTTTTRYDTFTEAVPLSLSSMAHLNIPLTDGVVDGIIQVIHHTIHQCVNYARICYHPTMHYTDITTTPYAWTPIRHSSSSSLSMEDSTTTTPPNKNTSSIPPALQKLHFQHCYSRNAFIYLKSHLPSSSNKEDEMNFWLHHSHDWPNYQPTTTTTTAGGSLHSHHNTNNKNNNYSINNNGILGRITLLYCSTEPLTQSELDGTDTKYSGSTNNINNNSIDEGDDDEENDVPPCICYQMIVEYRTLASSSSSSSSTTAVSSWKNTNAKYAEELSMLSFGGSIDDEIKYGALASLYDDLAKYVLEIYSVRGKKYKFDLMDSTLSNGTVPTFIVPSSSTTTTTPSNHNSTSITNTNLRPSSNSSSSITNKVDPFLKNLCVTVTDHHVSTTTTATSPITTTSTESNSNNTKTTTSIDTIDEEMKDVDNTTTSTSDNKNNTTSVVAATSSAVKNQFTIKGNGITRMYLTMEGKLRTRNSHNDPLQDVPAFDYLKNVLSYAFLRLNPSITDMVQAYPSGHTLLFDPDVAGHIYINGRYAMTWGDDSGTSASHGTALFGYDIQNIPFWNGRIMDYELFKESIAQLWYEILIDAKVQQLNIANKLLHRLMKGIDPTTEVEEEDFNNHDLYDDNIPDETTNIDVHQDCLESLVLAAPNYDRVGIAAKALATRFAMEFGKDAYPCLYHETEWVKQALPDRDPIVVPQRLINILRRGGYFDIQKTADLLWFNSDCRPVQEEYEIEIINIAVQYLEEAGCTDVDSDNIMIISSTVADNVVAKDAVCRYDPTTEQFYVHEDFMKSSINDLIGGIDTMETTPQQVKGYLLGMYIAKAHPVGYGKVLARYMIRNKL